MIYLKDEKLPGENLDNKNRHNRILQTESRTPHVAAQKLNFVVVVMFVIQVRYKSSCQNLK